MQFQIMNFRIIAVLCLFFINGLADGKNERDLRNHLYDEKGYDKLVRPVKKTSDVVHVEVQLQPIRLREVDDDLHVLTLDAWLTAAWNDQFLHWDPSKYGNMEYFRLPADEVWVPDLTIYSGIPETSELPKHTNVVIKSDGSVHWVPYFNVENRCSFINKTNLRADCVISLLSWTHDVTQMDITIKNETAMEYFEKDDYPGWDIESIKAERILKTFSCCPNPWPQIDFHVTLRRKMS